MKICLPPGLGDIHWVVLKIEDFMRRRGAEKADAWIWDVGGPRRAAEFVYRMPFLNFIDYAPIGFEGGDYDAICWGNQINYIEKKYGFDYVIAVNGWMEHGLPLATAMDGAAINWDYELRRLPDEIAYEEEQRKRGKWILLYFSEVAQFGSWIRYCDENKIRALAHMLHDRFPDHRLIFVGLPWDQPLMDRATSPYVENLAGRTHPSQYFALLRGADAMIGFANGNTILTSHFKIPTVMVWNRERYPNMGFRTNWLRPGAYYCPYEIEHWHAPHIVDEIERLMKVKETDDAATRDRANGKPAKSKDHAAASLV